MRQPDNVVVLTDQHTVLANLDCRTFVAARTQHHSYVIHRFTSIRESCYTLKSALRSSWGKHMTIGSLARRAGVRASAIRYYEARGLLRPSTRLPNTYRQYDESAVTTLNFICSAQAFGMTLDEIAELLRLADHGRSPCPRVREIARKHLRDVTKGIRELQTLRAHLSGLVARRSRSARAVHICPLVEGTAPRGAATLPRSTARPFARRGTHSCGVAPAEANPPRSS